MYDQTGKATADCAYVPRAIGEVNVRGAQTGALELVARIRLESGLAAPKLNGPPVHQGEKIARPHGRPPFLEKTRNFSVWAWLLRARLERGVVRGD